MNYLVIFLAVAAACTGAAVLARRRRKKRNSRTPPMPSRPLQSLPEELDTPLSTEGLAVMESLASAMASVLEDFASIAQAVPGSDGANQQQAIAKLKLEFTQLEEALASHSPLHVKDLQRFAGLVRQAQEISKNLRCNLGEKSDAAVE